MQKQGSCPAHPCPRRPRALHLEKAAQSRFLDPALRCHAWHAQGWPRMHLHPPATARARSAALTAPRLCVCVAACCFCAAGAARLGTRLWRSMQALFRFEGSTLPHCSHPWHIDVDDSAPRPCTGCMCEPAYMFSTYHSHAAAGSHRRGACCCNSCRQETQDEPQPHSCAYEGVSMRREGSGYPAETVFTVLPNLSQYLSQSTGCCRTNAPTIWLPGERCLERPGSETRPAEASSVACATSEYL